MNKQFTRVFSLVMVLNLAGVVHTSADQLTMQEGTNISLSVAENGGNSTITISSTDTNTDEKVKVSSSDTADFLESQIVGGTGVNVNSDGSQITISAPPVNVKDSSDGVEITVARQGEYDPGTGFVPVLDLNGTALVSTGITPTVTIGGINANLLATSENPQQIIAGIPSGFTTGNYKLKVENNDTGFSEGLVFLNNLIGGNDADTVLLLHADGTGSTFTDSSASAHSITANGDATQSTAQSKFGDKSAFFDGTGDYLSIPDSEDWNFGADNFTIDLWVKPISTSPSVQENFVSQWPSGGNLSFIFGRFPSNKVIFGYTVSGSYEAKVAESTNTLSGNWQHLALVRNGSDLKLFIDGVEDTGFAYNISNESIFDSSGSLHIGTQQSSISQYWDGYLDELRISKGIARWTANFTPPPAPYN